MKKFVIVLQYMAGVLLLSLLSFNVLAQNMKTVNAQIVDEDGNSLSGVNVTTESEKTISSDDGSFQIDVDPNIHWIELTKKDYNTIRLSLEDIVDKTIVLRKSYSNIMIPVLYGSKSRDEITGAISFIQGKEIENIPGTNRLNSISGQLPGVYNSQFNGLPGFESAL